MQQVGKKISTGPDTWVTKYEFYGALRDQQQMKTCTQHLPDQIFNEQKLSFWIDAYVWPLSLISITIAKKSF